ncbi:hypothetical protein FCULG_00011215 [Fusarium culmorum]|uniref:Arrestin C-terminal-like domain-containing protein n=1 Tax=Fusarium culmorum TaxID=5516 RepID=A0A2T4GYI8_FUSCU|nr:hypothetical protein FCULG_00011215 [Fusarium culmorum]
MSTLVGSGASCSIHLVEPSIFLPGSGCWYHDRPKARIKLLGHTYIEWEGQAGPDFREESDVQKQTSILFDATKNQDQDDYDFQCRYWIQNVPNPNAVFSPVNQTKILATAEPFPPQDIDNKGQFAFNCSEIRHPSTDSTISFTDETESHKIFYPGVYEYDFVFPITHQQLETTQVPHAAVKWMLLATTARPGLFHNNIRAKKEVTFVRSPDPLSLEMVQSIPFHRHSHDWLQYDIVVSGKSFPIGSQISIAMKLGPLENTTLHGFEFLINESIEYWFRENKINRKGLTRSVLLLKSTAGRAIIPSWTSAGQVSVHEAEAKSGPIHDDGDTVPRHDSVKASGAAASTSTVTKTVEDDSDNSDGCSMTLMDMVEIEAVAQVPTCTIMSRREDLRLHPKCTWKNIVIVLHVTQPDLSDPSGRRRIYRDTSISLPITILNCRSNQANMTLPSYSHDPFQPVSYPKVCGCPDALPLPSEKPPRRFVKAMVARHLVDDKSRPPDGLSIMDNTTNPSIPILNESSPPCYSDIVDDSNIGLRVQ